MTKRMVFMLLALTILFGGLFGFKWFEKNAINQYLANFTPPPVYIDAAYVKTYDWQRQLQTIGTITAINGVEISSEADGIVKAIHFESGDRVQAGDLLIELDDQVEVANLKSFQSRLRLAQLNFDRDSQLYTKKLTAQDQFDRSRAELDEAVALTEQTAAMIAQKKLRAPFAGKLGIRRVSRGQYIAAGDTTVTLQALNPVYIDFSFPEQYLPKIKLGQTLHFSVDAYKHDVFKAKVTAMDARVDVRTRNIAVRAIADNQDERLVPGMFADIALLLPASDTVLAVPETSITYTLYGESVFEIAPNSDGESVVTRRRITTGEKRDGQVEISGDITSGALIVINGQNKLKDGAKVYVNNRQQLDNDTTAVNP